MTPEHATGDDRGASILVVEDDRALREGLAMNLRMRGYDVTTAADGESGMQAAFDGRPDLIVLDIMLPDWSGLDILRELRKRRQTVPVLVLSARNAVHDKVTGLDLGADDYLTKPFDLPELLARIKVMLRRRRTTAVEADPLIVGLLWIDLVRREATMGGRQVKLSAKEFDLLALLAASPGRVFTRETILEQVWGWDYEGTARTVDNFVARLRKKIGGSHRGQRYIRTVPTVGYTLEVPKEPSVA